MRKNVYKILSIYLFVVLVSACYDDKGNYDYHEISEVKIEGLEESFSKIS